MRLLKLALISAIVLFLLATAITAFIPSRVRISRAINLKARPKAVLDTIANFDTWSQWNPLFMAQDSGRTEAGKISLRESQRTDSSFVTSLAQGSKPSVGAGWQVYTYPSADSLTLQWYMDFKLKWYPWQKFSSLFYESTYGVMMEQGLANFKQYIEN